MAYSSYNLQIMMGLVLDAKKNAHPEAVRRFLNGRIRKTLNYRVGWSDLQKTTYISLPNPYTTGTVSTTYGLPVLTGTATAWPVADVVNTTITRDLLDIGNAEVYLADNTGVTNDSVLLVDAGTLTAEAVSVTAITSRGSVMANFQFTHNAGATVTMSSLAGLQVAFGVGSSLFTIAGVVSPTQILMDSVWGGAPLANAPYAIRKVYVTIASDFRDFVSVVDPQEGDLLETHTQLKTVDRVDPQRTASGTPTNLIDFQPDKNGNMQFEVWPATSSARQIRVVYYSDWPEMQRPTDRPPPFLDPQLFVDGATADVLRSKVDQNDPFYDLQLADIYERQFKEGLELAVNADESKSVKNLTIYHAGSYYPRGGTYEQSHDIDLLEGNF